MERIVQDLRYALRQLRRAPAFAIMVVLVTGLGIGATAAVFTAVDSILLRPLDLPDSERLVTLCEFHEAQSEYCTASPPNVSDWQRQARTLEAVGLARSRGVALLSDEGERTRVFGAMATPGFLRATGVVPLHGRLFDDSDMLPIGDSRAVVLSHDLWLERYGGDPGIVGRSVRLSSDGDGQILDDDPVVVIGVLPPATRIPFFEDVRAWLPLQFDPASAEHRDWRGFQTLARIADGTDIATAERELNAIQARLAEAYPAELGGWRVDVVRARERIAGDARSTLLLFFGAVILVFLVVLVNLAGLMLARAVVRERELAIRLSVGAARRRIAAQLVTEGAVFATLGGAAGLLVAAWLVRLFLLFAPPRVPRLDEVALDGRVLAFAIVLTAVVAIVVGLVPALRLRGARTHAALYAGRAVGSPRAGLRWMRRALVSGQLALALALVLTAGLLLRSFEQMLRFDPGFDMRGVSAFAVYPPMARYPAPEDRIGFYDRVDAALEAIPGVTAAATASAGPLFGGGDGAMPFLVDGRDNPALQDAPRVQWYDVGPDYFPTLGAALIAGRHLSADDPFGSEPTALVNRAMAEAHWPDGSPIGALVSIPDFDVAVRIVGVVEDVRMSEMARSAEASIYVSNRQRPRGGTYFVVRSGIDAAALQAAVADVLRRVDPEVAPSDFATLDDRLAGRMVSPRFNVLIIGFFAIVALVLSALGLYAITEYAVSARTREFGIRFALGATRARVLAIVLAEGLGVVLTGIVFGGIGALWAARLLRGLLDDIAPGDPVAIMATILLMGVTGILAALGPALRASRTDPATAMRME